MICSCGPINPSRCSFLREKVTSRMAASEKRSYRSLNTDSENFTRTKKFLSESYRRPGGLSRKDYRRLPVDQSPGGWRASANKE